MLAVCVLLYIFNDSQSWPAAVRWALLSGTAVAILVESGVDVVIGPNSSWMRTQNIVQKLRVEG